MTNTVLILPVEQDANPANIPFVEQAANPAKTPSCPYTPVQAIANPPTPSELTRNFLAQYHKPFSPELLASMTNLPIPSAKRQLKYAVEDGLARILEPGIYCSIRQNQVNNSVRIKGGNWRFSVDTAKLVLDAIEKGKNNGCREIGEYLNISHQAAYMYLHGLASIGSIGMNHTGYIVLRRDNLLALGSNLQPGILSRLRAENSPNKAKKGATNA